MKANKKLIMKGKILVPTITEIRIAMILYLIFIMIRYLTGNLAETIILSTGFIIVLICLEYKYYTTNNFDSIFVEKLYL